MTFTLYGYPWCLSLVNPQISTFRISFWTWSFLLTLRWLFLIYWLHPTTSVLGAPHALRTKVTKPSISQVICILLLIFYASLQHPYSFLTVTVSFPLRLHFTFSRSIVLHRFLHVNEEHAFSLLPIHQELQVMASCLAIGDSMESIQVFLSCSTASMRSHLCECHS